MTQIGLHDYPAEMQIWVKVLDLDAGISKVWSLGGEIRNCRRGNFITTLDTDKLKCKWTNESKDFGIEWVLTCL